MGPVGGVCRGAVFQIARNSGPLRNGLTTRPICVRRFVRLSLSSAVRIYLWTSFVSGKLSRQTDGRFPFFSGGTAKFIFYRDSSVARADISSARTSSLFDLKGWPRGITHPTDRGAVASEGLFSDLIFANALPVSLVLSMPVSYLDDFCTSFRSRGIEEGRSREKGVGSVLLVEVVKRFSTMICGGCMLR